MRFLGERSRTGPGKIHHLSARGKKSRFMQKGIPAIIKLYGAQGSSLTSEGIKKKNSQFCQLK